MNIQAMMQQAQKMQKDVMNAKSEVENQIFKGKASLVEVEVNGKKEIKKVSIDRSVELSNDNIEDLEDMFLLAGNDAIANAEKAMNEKMEKINPSLKGLM